MLRCSMTGEVLRDPGDGIYDDGDWISWAWISQFLEDDPTPEEAKPHSGALQRMIESARVWEEETGLTSDLWGEIGERFAAEQFGVARHAKPNAQGSDGLLGKDFVEIKTITWKKRKARIQVKRSGNFSRLIFVRAHKDYTLEAVLLTRRILKKGKGKQATLSWKTALNHKETLWILQKSAGAKGS